MYTKQQANLLFFMFYFSTLEVKKVITHFIVKCFQLLKCNSSDQHSPIHLLTVPVIKKLLIHTGICKGCSDHGASLLDFVGSPTGKIKIKTHYLGDISSPCPQAKHLLG
jgi:hypothetical protein